MPIEMVGEVGHLSGGPFDLSAGKALGEARFAAGLVVANGPLLLALDCRIDEFDNGKPSPNGEKKTASALLSRWREVGPGALESLVGDFALAVYDVRDRSLYLAVDPAAQRSLHFRLEPPGVVFASRPARIARPRGAVDLPALADFAAFRFEMGPASFFAGVERVQAGEGVRIREGRIVSRERYWQPCLAPDERLTRADAVDEYRYLLSTAIRDRTPDAGLVATHLSSGYDSSAVTATSALNVGQDRILAFTAAPLSLPSDRVGRHRFADESRLAARAAAQLGIGHEIVRDSGPLAFAWREATRTLQSPCALPVNQSWLTAIRRRAADAGAGVLLAAYLGNESLNSGGVETLAEYVARGELLTWLRQALALRGHEAVSWRGVLFNSFGRLFPPRVWKALMANAPDRSPLPRGFVRDEWRTRFEDRDGRLPFSPARARLHGLRHTDGGMSRLASIEQAGIAELDPMADRRLLEWSLKLPPRLLLDKGTIRPVARAALADRLPAELLDNPRRGLQSADWPLHFTQSVAREVFEEVAACRAAHEILDLDAMRRIIDHFPDTLEGALRNRQRYQLELTFALSAGLFAVEFDRR